MYTFPLPNPVHTVESHCYRDGRTAQKGKAPYKHQVAASLSANTSSIRL